MAVASTGDSELQLELYQDLMRQLADRIVVHGHKNIELVQALVVSVIWYFPPDHFDQLKFYQLVHMAAVMAIDLGLGRRKSFRAMAPPATFSDSASCGTPFSAMVVRRLQSPDPMSIESRRTWLVCYYLASNTAMALHRPNLIRWTSFMAECVEVLTSSPQAAETDPYLYHLVWTHKLAEEIGVQFSMEDMGRASQLTELRTQHVLRGLERELEKYRAGVSPDLLHRESHLTRHYGKLTPAATLKISFNVINLYMHDLALQSDMQATQTATNKTLLPPNRAPPGVNSLQESLISADTPLTTAHISAISACLASITGVFDAFLAMDVAAARTLPSFNFMRVSYALVILIKIYFAARKKDSEIGRMLDESGAPGEDVMNVEVWLDRLLERFIVVGGEGHCRPAVKFTVVLVMLKSWFRKQTRGEEPKNGPQNTSNAQGECTQDRPPSHDFETTNPIFRPDQTFPSTPLHLLSEVATGDPRASQTQSTLPWLQRTSTGRQPFFADSPLPPTTTTAPPQPAPNIPDWLPPADPLQQDWGTDFSNGFFLDGFDMETLATGLGEWHCAYGV